MNKSRNPLSISWLIVVAFVVMVVSVGHNALAIVAPLPTLDSIVPNSGTTAGGTQVTLNGQNYNGLRSVVFDNTAATIVSSTNTQIVATTPAHIAGPVDITITSGNVATFSGAYTYVQPPAPNAQSMNPTSGTTAGGTQVTITGQHFSGVTSVTFGGVAATVQSSSDTQIVASTGAHAAGAVDVVVTTPNGNSTLAGAYTYIAPPPPSGSTPTCRTDEQLVCSHDLLGAAVNICIKADLLNIHLISGDYLGVCLGSNTSGTLKSLTKIKL